MLVILNCFLQNSAWMQQWTWTEGWVEASYNVCILPPFQGNKRFCIF